MNLYSELEILSFSPFLITYTFINKQEAIGVQFNPKEHDDREEIRLHFIDISETTVWAIRRGLGNNWRHCRKDRCKEIIQGGNTVINID